ncbi:MAG: SDR family oxidoreductase [Flavobacteriales bacterium]|nr:SDR family oxidoreductase [Flavobacteriales bacterium]MCB9174735.1 SDR family oxidoreductase [Flavobacteriales bacterium]
MVTPFHLTDKLILVTGSTSGIGSQVVKSIILMGGRVVVSGRNQGKLDELQAEYGESILQCIKCDLTDEKEIENLAFSIENIDGVVHCAGVVNPYPVKYLSFEKMDETMKLNFYSPVSLIAFLDRKKKLKRNASLVFVSSISAQYPHKGGAAYSSSKAALESFSKVIAMEYSHKGIRSNVVAPAMVKTPLYEKASEDASHESMQAHIDKYPLGIGMPDDVANAVIYLLSDASRWVTGTNIVLDGGCLLGY